MTEIGLIPADWEVKRLGDCATIARGGSPRPIESYLTTQPDGLNWVKIGDVTVGAKYIEKTAERILPSGLSSTREVRSGDFLLSNSMSFGRPYIMKISGCIHDGWLVIQDYKNDFDQEFLYYVLGSDLVLKQYATYAAGSSVLNLNKDVVSRVVVMTPSLAEQKAIAEVLSDMDAEISELEAQKAKFESIKQGMMQELLTGKIRLV
jgi:type I restriction enzyme S subunit